MVSADELNALADPVEILETALERAWHTFCETFDVKADLPDNATLFDGADLISPDTTAQKVLVNMLLEITECVGRFSPWYRMPARAYGLTSVRDSTTNRVQWMLAPEAVVKWLQVLETLAIAIRNNSGLLQAMILVEGLMARAPSEDACMTVSCDCIPPRIIKTRQSILEKAEIVCTVCQQRFT